MIRFVLFAILAVTVSLAGERTALAQKQADPKTALKAKVTMSFKGNAPISELLTTISKNQKLTFKVDEESFKVAGEEMFPSIKPDKFEVKDVVLSKVLTDILKPLRASYIVEKDHVLNIPLK